MLSKTWDHTRSKLLMATLAVAALAAGCGLTDDKDAQAHEEDAREQAQLPPSPLSELRTVNINAPVRHSRSYRTSKTLQEVPVQLDRVEPVSFAVQVSDSARPSDPPKAEYITRAADRMHVRFSLENHQEWLFIRNPMDPRRAKAQVIDHKLKTILEYEESDLLDAGMSADWLQIATLGNSPNALPELFPSDRIQSYRDIPCREYSTPPESAPLRQVCWNEELFLPLRAVIRQGEATLVRQITDLQKPEQPELLHDPSERFPEYAVMDLADWREEHHGH
jgi:hypothetical protein